MDRRTFIATVVGILTPLPAAEAQPAGRPARVGFLTPSSKLSFESGGRLINREAFSGRLRELGWSEGQNLVIESRYADGAYDRLQALAAELVSLPVDVIFANSAPAALAAKRATTSIPIVFETLGEPISAGLVSSLARPERNLTGISGLGPELSGKRLELLRELLPGLRRVALLVNPRNVMTEPTVRETEKAAAILQLRVDVVEVRSPGQLEGSIGGVGGDGTTAMIIVPDPMLLSHARRIQALLLIEPCVSNGRFLPNRKRHNDVLATSAARSDGWMPPRGLAADGPPRRLTAASTELRFGHAISPSKKTV